MEKESISITKHWEENYTIQDFPDKGPPTPERGGGAPTYDWANFSENCMKMKKFRARGGREGLRSATEFQLPNCGKRITLYLTQDLQCCGLF